MRNPLAILAILILSVSTGCLYNNPYPYGYNGGGGSYYGPGSFGTPQQPIPTYPPGSYPSNGAPTLSDPTYTPGAAPNNGPTLSEPSNPPPTFRETPPDKTVPYPVDEPGSGSGATGPTLQPTKAAKSSDELDSPFEQESSTQIQRGFEQQFSEAEPVYEAPILRQVSGSEEPQVLQQANRESIPRTTPATPSQPVFSHHPRYEWLRGIVEFDQQSETWVMMYDDNPDHTDKLGGVVTLSNHPSLKRLQDGQAVRVEGSFDKSATDSSGKPVYRIAKLTKPNPAEN